MSTPDDNGTPPSEPVLPYGERYAWGYLTTAIAVPVVYAAIMLGRLGDTPADRIDFQVPLLLAMGASVLLNMFLAPPPRRGRDRSDERDKAIARRGDLGAYRALVVGALGVFALAMFEAAPFWIANALYFAFVVSAVVQSIVKIAAYRRGW